MNNIQDIFDIQQQREPRAGDLLVVEPFLREVHFRRSVILLIDHSDSEGSVGLVLNKISNIKLHEVLRYASCKREVPLYIGGPVEHGRLLYIHTLGGRIRDAVALENGIFLGGNFDDVLEYVDSEEYEEGRIKFFAGYSGWTAGQLANEIKEKTWAVAPLEDAHVAMTGRGDEYWHTIVETLGEKYRAWLLCPSEPQLN